MNENPLILAVETSGRFGSAAIAIAGELLAETEFSAPMRHGAELFVAVRELFSRFEREPGQIDHVYISIGPGSFTGLRIAVTLAKIMHLANNKVKIVAVDTLDVIAANSADYLKTATEPAIDKIATVLDAKRGQFYIAVYQNQVSANNKIAADCLITAEEFTEKFVTANQMIFLLGEGLVYYKDKFAGPGVEFLDETFWYPKARKVHKLGLQKALAGQFTDPLTLKPKYLRQPVA